MTSGRRPWSDSYRAVHYRLNVYRGRASESPCSMLNCPNDAAEWAYDGTDPTPLIAPVSGFSVEYSANLDRYRPLCRHHHRVENPKQAGGRYLNPRRDALESWLRDRTAVTVAEVSAAVGWKDRTIVARHLRALGWEPGGVANRTWRPVVISLDSERQSRLYRLAPNHPVWSGKGDR